MLFTRKIGKILRGKATPFQILAAAVLGGLIGFVPTFMGAPGLVIALVLVLVILNANLGVAAITLGLGKLLSLALLPVSFHLGVWLSTGPTEPLLRAGANTPVLAFFGFERPAVSGSIVLGLIFGVVVGLLLVKLLNGFRRKMASVEEGSERYKKYMSKGWVRALVWIFAGSDKAKGRYAELLNKRVGNPVRILGVVFAGLVVALLIVARLFFAGPIVTAALTRGLERANGATVDVQSADLDLSESRLTINGLAMADPNNLSTDLLRAVRVEGNISATDLLTKRIALDNVVVIDASTGEKRKVPGVLVGPGPKPTPPPPEQKTLEDYIKEAQKWKDRLAQVRRWLEEVSRRPEEPPTEPGAPKRETIGERLARRARQLGYANVVAAHLIDDHPRLLVRRLQIDGLRGVEMPGRAEPEMLEVTAENLSTEPWLVAEAPKVTVTTRSGLMDANVVLASIAGGAAGGAAGAGGPSESRIAFNYRQMPADVIGQALKPVAGSPPIQGGAISVSLDGVLYTVGAPSLDLPLNVTLTDTTLSIPGAGSTHVDSFMLPIGLKGPIDNPGIVISDQAISDALVAAGKAEVAKRLSGEAEKAIDKAKEKLGDEIGDKAKDRLGDLLGGGDKDKKKDD